MLRSLTDPIIFEPTLMAPGADPPLCVGAPLALVEGAVVVTGVRLRRDDGRAGMGGHAKASIGGDSAIASRLLSTKLAFKCASKWPLVFRCVILIIALRISRKGETAQVSPLGGF